MSSLKENLSWNWWQLRFKCKIIGMKLTNHTKVRTAYHVHLCVASFSGVINLNRWKRVTKLRGTEG